MVGTAGKRYETGLGKQVQMEEGMGRKKEYEEKQRHGTAELPLGLHKMEYPDGTDAIFYLHWHQEFEFLVVTRGMILFTIEER